MHTAQNISFTQRKHKLKLHSNADSVNTWRPRAAGNQSTQHRPTAGAGSLSE